MQLEDGSFSQSSFRGQILPFEILTVGIDTLRITVVTVSLIALDFPYLHVVLFVLFKLNSFFMFTNALSCIH